MEIQLNKIHPAVLITTQHCWLFWFLLLQRKFLLVKSTELFTHFSINKGKFAENFLHDLEQWNRKSQKKNWDKSKVIKNYDFPHQCFVIHRLSLWEINLKLAVIPTWKIINLKNTLAKKIMANRSLFKYLKLYEFLNQKIFITHHKFLLLQIKHIFFVDKHS